MVDAFNWHCHAYCLMINDYRLLVETPDANLSEGMRPPNGVFTQGTNGRNRCRGHVFQSCFKAALVDADSYLSVRTGYVVSSPARFTTVGCIVCSGRCNT